MMNDVRAWEEKLVLPTYLPAEPEKNPIFLEKRVYQGSSGAVYPNPVIEKIAQEKSDREYTALWIENKYLRILVLPELGGRIHRAFDKIRNRDFVYYNSVVKPALVGLTGPWISGGIEFNWPQHHRPSTFDPIDYSIQDNEDGSKTIWVNEIEVMSRTKGMAGFTLYPDKAYLEIKGRLFNRTPLPQTFLWWANPAVKVNDHYQSIFPPDVHAVFDHGKRDVSDFPIATGMYYKVNYAPGTDISRYKNIPVPTSFMAAESKYDFIGGYEHDTRAGMLHVADHHFSPGKKQWTWGNGDFGKAWDRNLTDEDGPYIELMCGVYTDNQPDFSWLQPNEEKTFEQYFMPYAEIGVVHCASKDVAVSFELQGQKAEKGRGQKAEGNETDDVICRIYSSGEYRGAQIELILISGHRAEGGGRFSASSLLFSKSIDLSPEKPLSFTIQIPGDVKQEDLRLEICDATGELLLSYQPDGPVKKPIPPAATAAKEPAEVETTEQLYLNGLHLEQYRHATFSATAYYEEALRREPNDIRNNNALGKWYLRHGQPEKAEAYLRKAVKAITVRNGNPYDGEPLYNLGLCLSALEQFDEAYDVFYKSTWNDAFQHNGYLQLARIAVRRSEFKNALYLVDKSLNRNYNSTAARHLKVSILRRLGRTDEAVKLALCALKADPFSLGCEFELKLMNAGADKRSSARKTFNNYTETALDYAHAGMYKEAELLLRSLPTANDSPLKHYYMGWFNLQMNNADAATEHFTAASETPADFCFPSRTEDTVVLKAAVAQNPSDAKAQYLLGNYWYAHHNQNEAIACWERSVELDPSFPTAFRNLALAYYNHANDPQKAIEAMEKAFELDNKDARVLMELDQLYRQLNYSAWFRLNLLEEHVALVEQRHDLYLERVTLYNQIGDHETADALMSEWKFQPWEGGEGKVVSQFILCQTELAKQAMNEEEYEKAITLLSSTDSYPENLGEGKLPNVPANDLHYWKGVVYEKKGEQNLARQEFEAAMSGGSEATQAIFYNDAGPEHVFFKGKALQKTGRTDEAKQLFQNLISFGEEHMHDEIKIDYFAVSLPDLRVFNQDLNLKNKIHCNYLLALGYLGLGKKETADKYFEEVLKRDANHQGALQMRHDCLL